MTPFGILRGFGREIRLNLNAGALAWAAHRITGVTLVAYLLLHLLTLGTALNGASSLQFTLTQFEGAAFAFLESAIVVIAAYHAFNGLRLIAIDICGFTRRQRQLIAAVGVAWAGALIWTTKLFFERALGWG